MIAELFFSIGGGIVVTGFASWLHSCGKAFIEEARERTIKTQGEVDQAQLARRKVALDQAVKGVNWGGRNERPDAAELVSHAQTIDDFLAGKAPGSTARPSGALPDKGGAGRVGK